MLLALNDLSNKIIMCGLSIHKDRNSMMNLSATPHYKTPLALFSKLGSPSISHPLALVNYHQIGACGRMYPDIVSDPNVGKSLNCPKTIIFFGKRKKKYVLLK